MAGKRRWLQLGAASAGVSAALFGLSALGPQVGVALADESGTSSSASDGSTGSESSGSSAGGARPGSAQTSSPGAAGDSDAGPKTSVGSSPSSSVRDAAETEKVDEPEATKSDVKKGDAEKSDAKKGVVEKDEDQDEKSVVAKPATAALPSTPTPEIAKAVAPETNSSPWAVQVEAPEDPHERAVADQLTTWTNDSLGWIDSLPVPGELKWHLEGALWTTRRSLFNVAPTVAPLTVSGLANTAVNGRVDAVDPENDAIVYRLVRGPSSGTVQLNADGSFTYTPGEGFDGVDSFVVLAQDLGLHVNLLDPFRGAGTAAGALVNQGAIKFDFNYTTGADVWSPARRAALNEAAEALTPYFLVTAPVTLSYAVTGTADPENDVLASAGSGLVGFGVPAFCQTVVQYKMISGIDANGAAADGVLNWNWGYSWALGDSVGSTEFDFRAIVFHELLHSFGFTSVVGEPGTNTGTYWAVYDGYIVDASGNPVITKDFTWDTAFDANVTGANGGLYFGGPNAVAAYGKPVPVYTPVEFTNSAVAHLDDATFTGVDQQLMNAFSGTGPRLRVLSPIELGILKDIGYTVVDGVASTPETALQG